MHMIHIVNICTQLIYARTSNNANENTISAILRTLQTYFVIRFYLFYIDTMFVSAYDCYPFMNIEGAPRKDTWISLAQSSKSVATTTVFTQIKRSSQIQSPKSSYKSVVSPCK